MDKPVATPAWSGRTGPKAANPRREADLERLDRFANLLDARFRLPGTNWRFGLDTIIGLVPGAGDLVTVGPQAWLIWQGYQMGASRATLLRMAANAGIDLTLGSVPIVGDIFDMVFKANMRNVRLLRQEIAAR